MPVRPRHQRISGQAFDGGAQHRGIIKGIRVTADDVRDRRTPCSKAATFQRLTHRPHMLAQAALRKQRARNKQPPATTERSSAP
jgi:hypothetical protein